MPWVILGLDRNLGTAKSQNATSWKQVLAMDNRNLNILSLARLFLFASRDFWFEVPLPFYLRSPRCEGLMTSSSSSSSIISQALLICPDNFCVRGALCNAATNFTCRNANPGGGCGGLGFDRVLVGTFLGGYIILYGQVQSWTPQLVTGPLGQTPPNKWTEVLWGMVNCIPTLIIAIVITWAPNTFRMNDYNLTSMTSWLVTIIVLFAIIFAINSSIHSFLVVKYAKKDKIAKSVGFYYMSNAFGRLFGTIGSGILYTYVGEHMGQYAGSNGTAGLAACFLAGTLSSLLAALITIKIDDNNEGLQCGPCTLIRSIKQQPPQPTTTAATTTG
jgi:hypothetical protein